MADFLSFSGTPKSPVVTTSELTIIFLAHHELQTEQEVKESCKWAESPNRGVQYGGIVLIRVKL